MNTAEDLVLTTRLICGKRHEENKPSKTGNPRKKTQLVRSGLGSLFACPNLSHCISLPLSYLPPGSLCVSSFSLLLSLVVCPPLGQEDRIQHAAARLSLFSGGGGGGGAVGSSQSSSSSSQRHQGGSTAGTDSFLTSLGGASSLQPGSGGSHSLNHSSHAPNAAGAGGTFRIAEVAASTPEMRFLRHFYTAVSLLTDPDGL